jgi:hypothetical protein
MVTKLHGLLRRELTIKGRAYVVALDESGLKLTLKGRRLGQQLKWEDLASGDAALATALNASLAHANDLPAPTTASGLSKRGAGPKTQRPAKTGPRRQSGRATS